MTLYLKDHKTGTTIELADSKTYSFSGKNGISSNQLSLIYRDDSTLGLDDEVLDFDFKVLEQGLELDFGKSMHVSGYAIYDISGKILLHVSEDINVRTLNVPFHEKGMYILRLQTSTGITNWKFVR